MNTFVLDTDPKVAASYHADQHLHKMILESAGRKMTWNGRAVPEFMNGEI